MNESDKTALRNILKGAYISPLVIDALVKTISANGFARPTPEPAPPHISGSVSTAWNNYYDPGMSFEEAEAFCAGWEARGVSLGEN